MLSNVIPIGYVHHVTQYLVRILPLDRELIMIVELKDILNKIFNYFSITELSC